MTPPSTYDLLQKISEIQIQLAEVMKESQHQTSLIVSMHEDNRKLAQQADAAEDKAELALARADQALKELEHEREEARKAQKERKVDRRWLLGTALTLLGLVTPILIRFYLN